MPLITQLSEKLRGYKDFSSLHEFDSKLRELRMCIQSILSSVYTLIAEEARKDSQLLLEGDDIEEQIEQMSKDRIKDLMGYFVAMLIVKDIGYITSMQYPTQKEFSISI